MSKIWKSSREKNLWGMEYFSPPAHGNEREEKTMEVLNMWELVIKWASGDKTIYSYDTRAEAERAGDGMETALGEQIQWYGVRPRNHARRR